MKNNFKKATFILVIFFASNYSLSQNFGECGVDSILGIEPRQLDCTNSSTTWLNKYRKPEFWVANEDVPLKTIMVNFVVLLDDDGEGGWKDSPAFREQVDSMFTRINEYYGEVPEKGFDMNCEP